MLEMLLQKPPASTYYGTSGPGPKTLKYGNLQLGYFGTVTAAQMFTGPELSTLLGFTAGQDSAPASMYWFKFAYKGKILFIPSLQLRTFVSWNDIYAVGAVYGTKSNGAYPATPAKYQYTTVQKVEGPTVWGFVTRLMTGWPDPTYPGSGLDAYPQSSDSEWQQLIGRVCTSANGNISEKWDAKSADLISVNPTMQCWTQETQATDVTKGNSRGAIYNAYAIIGSSSVVKSGNGVSDYAWRPVLELLPMDALLDPMAVAFQMPMPQPPSIIQPVQATAPATDPVALQNPVNVTTSWPTKQPVVTLGPVGVLSPVNVTTSWPTKQPVLCPAQFTGSALGPTNVRGSDGANLNPFTITGAGSQLLGDPVNVVYSLATLNPFSISGVNIP